MKNISKFIFRILVLVLVFPMSINNLVVSAEENSEDLTEITFWYANSGVIGENNEELTNLFNETIGSELGISVKAEFQGSYSDLQSKLTSSYIAGEAPDVSVLEISATEIFVDAGLIQPLDDIFTNGEIDDFYPGLLQNSYIDNKLYAVPYLRSNPIFYYNKTLFEKAGIEESEIQEVTYEKLAEWSKKLKEIEVDGFGFNAFAWNYNPQKSFESDPESIEAEVGKVYNAEVLAELSTFFRDSVENNNFRFFSGGNASEERELAVLNQTTAIWQGSTGSLQKYLDIAEENGFELGTMPTPIVNGHQSVNSGGANLVVISEIDEPKREAAIEFVKFLTAPEQIITSHLNTGYLITRKSLIDNEQVISYHKEYPAYETAAGQLEYSFGAAMHENYYQSVELIMDAFEEVVTSEEDPLTILTPVVEEALELLSE